MTDDTAAEFWGERVAEYDDFIRRVVPGYDAMTARLLESLPADPGRVLELGCGTGNLSLLLAERFPGSRFTFVDGAPEMLDAVRGRLREDHPEVEARSSFIASTFESLRLERRSFDLAVSSLALHHVEELAPVYGMIAEALADGGQFRSTDGVRAASADQYRLDLERWEGYWREGGRLSDEEIASVQDHIVRHDHYETVESHLRMLAAAGLSRCDCIWRDGLFAILSAERERELERDPGEFESRATAAL